MTSVKPPVDLGRVSTVRFRGESNLRSSAKISYAPRKSLTTKSSVRKEESKNSFREKMKKESSFAGRVVDAGAVDTRQIWTIIGVIFSIIVSVNSLAFVIVEYGIFKGGTEFSKGDPATACFTELEHSGFDISETEKYDEWFDDRSVMELSQTGVYRGASGIKEYAEFIYRASYFQFYKRSRPLVPTPIHLTEDECIINFSTGTRVQTNATFGVPQCWDEAAGYTLYYTVRPKFYVSRINLFYSDGSLSKLFGEVLNTDQVRDHICNIMEFNCPSTFQFNNLTTSSCREQYDVLPSTNTLDDKSKGCRILHSSFAEINPDHCPHLSFAPQIDYNGDIKCQESKNTTPEDLFSEYELDKMHEIAVLQGFPADTLYNTCAYDPTGSFIGEEDKEKFNLGFTGKIPTAALDMQNFLCYVTFIMFATLVLTGLGTEFLFLVMVLQGNWNQDKENKWKVAQFLFPLLGATTLGLAITHNYLAFPFLIVTLWKFGFPETILYLHAGIYDTDRSYTERLVDFMNGAGTVTHHQAVALYISAVVTGLHPADRVVVQGVLPLVMQHWIVLMRYSNKWIYVVCEVLLEVWFEWTAFASLEIVHRRHWTGGIIVATMLFAHWVYFTAGLLSLSLHDEDNELGAEQLLRSIKIDNPAALKIQAEDDSSEDSVSGNVYEQTEDFP